MKLLTITGTTDQTVDIFIQDSTSTTGAGLTGLVHNSAGLVCYYRKGATGAATALTLVTQTVGGAHSDGGFVEVSSTNMPGLYRLDLSDVMVDANGSTILILKGATNMAPVLAELQCITNLPSNVTQFGGVAGSFASGIPAVNTTQFGGVAGSFASGIPATNATQISGSAATSDLFEQWLSSWTTGTAQAGAAGTITLAAGSSSVTNDLKYVGGFIGISAGTGAGQGNIGTAYNGTTKILTILNTWTVTPDNTSVYFIIPKGIQVASNSNPVPAVLTATSREEVADSILLRRLDRVGNGTDVADERTVVNALRAVRNKTSITGGTLTVTKEDDTTTAWTAAVSTAAGNPITGVDPT